MLTDGIDHVATITNDGDRFIDFYTRVFGATVETQADHQRPMFERGRIGHIGFHAADLDSFAEIRERLMAEGATDGTVTEFGRKISLFFRDPDLHECEVLHANPDAEPGALQFGTASERFPDRAEISPAFVPLDER